MAYTLIRKELGTELQLFREYLFKGWMNDSEASLAQTHWAVKDLGVFSPLPNITRRVEEHQDGLVAKHEMQLPLVRGEDREGLILTTLCVVYQTWHPDHRAIWADGVSTSSKSWESWQLWVLLQRTDLTGFCVSLPRSPNCLQFRGSCGKELKCLPPGSWGLLL